MVSSAKILKVKVFFLSLANSVRCWQALAGWPFSWSNFSSSLSCKAKFLSYVTVEGSLRQGPYGKLYCTKGLFLLLPSPLAF
jgi:hypothetical protein